MTVTSGYKSGKLEKRDFFENGRGSSFWASQKSFFEVGYRPVFRSKKVGEIVLQTLFSISFDAKTSQLSVDIIYRFTWRSHPATSQENLKNVIFWKMVRACWWDTDCLLVKQELQKMWKYDNFDTKLYLWLHLHLQNTQTNDFWSLNDVEEHLRTNVKCIYNKNTIFKGFFWRHRG